MTTYRHSAEAPAMEYGTVPKYSKRHRGVAITEQGLFRWLVYLKSVKTYSRVHIPRTREKSCLATA